MSHEDRELVISVDAEQLAASVAARLLVRATEVQAARGTASLVLTGGRTGIGVLDHVRNSPDRDLVDWSRVEVFWGDERFVGREHPDRNDRQARSALLDHVAVDPDRVHPMAASDGFFGDDVELGAAAYRRVVEDHSASREPAFDICLLGVGEDGHVASIFPGRSAMEERYLAVVAVHDSPKPPPTRITLTMPTLGNSSEVWLLTTGTAKARAVAIALSGGAETGLPAAAVRGRDRTVWFVDVEAASDSGRQAGSGLL